MNLDEQVNKVELPKPRSVARIVARVFLAAVIILIGLSAWKISSTAIRNSTDSVTNKIDPLTVPRLRAQIAEVDSEIDAAQDALSKFENQTKSRWVSREGDRVEFNRLNQEVLDLRCKRAHLDVDLTDAINRIALSHRIANTVPYDDDEQVDIVSFILGKPERKQSPADKRK